MTDEIRVEYMPLGGLIRANRNAKRHRLDELEGSMRRFGYTAPMLLNEATGRLVAGHGRLDTLEARKAAGYAPPARVQDRGDDWYVPVLRGVSFRDEREAEAYILADNRLVEIGGYDSDVLAEMARDVAEAADGLEGTGWTQAEIADLAAAEAAFQAEAEQAAAEADEAAAGEDGNDGATDPGDEPLVVDVHDLRAPFPWFGGKSRAAGIVWGALGDVPNYVEPFFGSGAVLLARPGGPGKIETVNDLDRWVANFWRAVAQDPEAVAAHADWPVNEADLHARHKWLLSREEWKARMQDGENPDYFDARIAGRWVWGLCAWIGSGWCAPKGEEPSEQVPHLSGSGQGLGDAGAVEPLAGPAAPSEQMPFLGHAGRGGHRGRMSAPSEKLPSIGDGGRGIHARSLMDAPSEQLPHLQAGSMPSEKIPHLSGQGQDPLTLTANIIAWMEQLRDRMRRVRVSCGSWERVLTPAVTTGHGLTGVMLDPPYAEGADDLYGNHDKSVSAKVRAWAIEHGDDPLLRIAFCGYAGEHEAFPKGWRCIHWKAQGGYGSGNGNPYRERIWLSPHCLAPAA